MINQSREYIDRFFFRKSRTFSFSFRFHTITIFFYYKLRYYKLREIFLAVIAHLSLILFHSLLVNLFALS